MTAQHPRAADTEHDDSAELMDWLEDNAESAIRVMPDEEGEEEDPHWEVSKGGSVTGRGATLREATRAAMEVANEAGQVCSPSVGAGSALQRVGPVEKNKEDVGILRRVMNKMMTRKGDVAMLQPEGSQVVGRAGNHPILTPTLQSSAPNSPAPASHHLTPSPAAVTKPLPPMAAVQTPIALTRSENLNIVEAQLSAATNPKEIVRISQHLDAVVRGEKSGAYVPLAKSSEYQALNHLFDSETCPKERTRIASHLRAMDLGTAVASFVSRDEIERERARLNDELESSDCPRERFSIVQKINNLPR
jgi:hypothetical protein